MALIIIGPNLDMLLFAFKYFTMEGLIYSECCPDGML